MQEKKIEYYSTGEIRSEIWTTTQLDVNTIHRNDGPAWIFYNVDGKIVEQEWFWYGVIMSFTQWIEVSNGPTEILVQLKLTHGGNNEEKNINQ